METVLPAPGHSSAGEASQRWRQLLRSRETALRIAGQAARELLRRPALGAVLIAVVWRFSGGPVPAFLLQAAQVLGNTVTGL